MNEPFQQHTEQPVTATTPAETPRPRLRRDLEHRMLGGVCAGIAARYSLDPILVRAGFVLASVIGSGIGVIVYVALWLLMPAAGAETAPRELLRSNIDDIAGRARVGAAAAAAGARHPAETARATRSGASRLGQSLTAAAGAARESWRASAPPPAADAPEPAATTTSESGWPPATNPAG
jgi:phage shock protein PspC (stress-responsive transcriptional regulator)